MMVLTRTLGPYACANPAVRARGHNTLDEFIIKPLMIPLAVVVLDELGDRPS